jgi:DedD protein
VAVHTQDEAFHEIQLNGKQLVFLFMAATVVSVVIFLCGVLVGRGVRAERGGDTVAVSSTGDVPAPTVAAAPAATPAGADPRQAAPPETVGDLTYFNRLDNSGTPAEDLKAPAAKPQPKVDPKAAAAPKPAPERAAAVKPAAQKPAGDKPAAAKADQGTPAGSGYAVQVAALNVRGEADAIAKRLSSKGYAAYVMTPSNGTPQVFRVRIGKFQTRKEAEAIAGRLEKEEQFKPWVTR